MPPNPKPKNRHLGGGELGEWVWVSVGKTEHKAQRVILPAAEQEPPPPDMVPPPQPSLEKESGVTDTATVTTVATATTTPPQLVLIQWESTREREYVLATDCTPLLCQQRPSRTKAKPQIEDEKQIVVGKADPVNKELKKKQKVALEKKRNAKEVAAASAKLKVAPAATAAPLLRQTIVKLKSAKSTGKNGSGAVAELSNRKDSLLPVSTGGHDHSRAPSATARAPKLTSGTLNNSKKMVTTQAASVKSARGKTNAASATAAAAHMHGSPHKKVAPLQPAQTSLASEARDNNKAAGHVQRPTNGTLNNNRSTLPAALLTSARGTTGSRAAAAAAAVSPAQMVSAPAAAASAPLQIMVSRGSPLKKRTARKSIVAAAAATVAEAITTPPRRVAVLKRTFPTETNNRNAAAHVQKSDGGGGGGAVPRKRRRGQYDGSLLLDASPNWQPQRRASNEFSNVRVERLQTAAKASRSRKRAAASRNDSSSDDRKPASRNETRHYSEWSTSAESDPTSDNIGRKLKVKKQRQKQPPPVEVVYDVINLLDSSDDEENAAGPPAPAAVRARKNMNDYCNNDDDDQSDVSDRKPKARAAVQPNRKPDTQRDPTDIIDFVASSSDDEAITAPAPAVAAAVRAQPRLSNETVPVALTKSKRRYRLLRENSTLKKKTTTVVPENVELDDSVVNDSAGQMHETDLFMQQVQRGKDGRYKAVAKSSASSSYQCGGESLFFANRYLDKYPRLIQITIVDADNNYSSVYKTAEQIHPLPNLYLPRMEKLYKSSSDDDDEGGSDGDVQRGDDDYFSGE